MFHIVIIASTLGPRLAFNRSYLKSLKISVENVKALREAHKYSSDMIINMDEYFDMPSSHTVSKKGLREVRIRSTGAEKRCYLGMYSCRLYATTYGHI